VKEAVFSFDRFHIIDPILGPEMKSTGEVIGTGEDFGEAYAKAQNSAGTVLPVRGRIFVSVHDQDKATMCRSPRCSPGNSRSPVERLPA